MSPIMVYRENVTLASKGSEITWVGVGYSFKYVYTYVDAKRSSCALVSINLS